MSRLATLAALLATLGGAAPAGAQQMGAGVDPALVAAMEQMISYVWAGCQMGAPDSCANVQAMQMQAQDMLAAGQICMTQGDPGACDFYQRALVDVQSAYAQMMQGSGGQMGMGPDQDPGNPLGGTHDQRMANIAAWGASNTANWEQLQARIDANHAATLGALGN